MKIEKEDSEEEDDDDDDEQEANDDSDSSSDEEFDVNDMYHQVKSDVQTEMKEQLTDALTSKM